MLSTMVLFSCLFLIVAMGVARADEVATVPAIPEWAGQVLMFIASIPKVGPVFEIVLLWVGSLAAFFTALTVFARAVLGIPMVVAKFAGAKELSDKIEAIYKKVSYYLDFLSIFNANKKK